MTSQKLTEALNILNEAKRNYRKPKWPARMVTDRIGMSGVTIRMWSARGVLTLDADKERAAGGWRLFSDRDVVTITAAHELSRLGVEIPQLIGLIKAVGDRFEPRVTASTYDVEFVYIHRDHDGKFIASADQPQTAAFIVLDLKQLGRTAFAAVGSSFALGTASEIQAAVAAMKKQRKPRKRDTK